MQCSQCDNEAAVIIRDEAGADTPLCVKCAAAVLETPHP